MKKQILFKSALSLVAAAAAGSAWATDVAKYGATFESAVSSTEPLNDFAYVLNTSITNGYSSNGAGWFGAEGDTSSIVAGNNGQVLKLNTEGNDLENRLASQVASDVTAAVAADGAYFKAKVKFVASDSLAAASTITPGEDGEDAKFAIYAYAHEDGSATNLVVYHGYVDGNGDPQYVNEEFTSAPIDTEAFTEICVRMFQEEETGNNAWCFTVSVDGGQPLESTAGEAEFSDSTWMRTLCDLNGAGATSISKIVFKGTGEVDDIAVGTVEASAGYSASITLPTGCTLTGVTVGGVSVTPETTIEGLSDGAVVAFTYTNADGVAKTATVTINGADGTATLEAYTWADYLGESVAGAYQIDDFADLDMLRKGVVAGLTTSGETFKQTADIDMSSAGAFAGIGAYEKIPTDGTPFLGTYDGQGYTIANVTRAGENTQGIFNQVGPSGVIENLVVSNMVAATGVTGFGFAIVGNAGGGATLRNLTAAGTFASADNPGQHNMAGIVVRLAPGATSGAATTIDSCTNNATIYGKYTKLGGINAIVQNQTGFVDGKVVFVNCANNGTLVCKRTYADCHPGSKDDPVTGTAGIVAYFSGTNVELTGCYSNGDITNADGANTDKDGALVGWTYGGTIKDNGGNSAPANKKMIGTWGSATETGFLYATVDNGVATTISSEIAAGGDYLLEGNATPAITLQANESVAFDTALGYTLTTNSIAAASGLELQVTPSGTKTTFTAVSAAAEDWVADVSDIPAGTTAGQQYSSLAGTELADADAAELTTWAKAKSVTFGDATTNADTDLYVDAFLLDCAPTAAAVADEKDAFVLTITFENGVPKVNTPTGKNYRGLQMKGSNDLSTWTDVSAASADYKFYKCVLSL